MKTFEIGQMTEPAVARSTFYVPTFSPNFSTNILPSPTVPSTDTSKNNTSNKLLTSPKEITKAEVCVIHFHEDSFCFR